MATCEVACEFGLDGKVCQPANFPHKVFGVGEACNDTETDVALVGGMQRYHLYPRIVQENSTYLNHTVQINGGVQKVDIVLYQGDKFIYSGLRILETVCYQQIIEIINASLPIVGYVEDKQFKVYGQIEVSAGQSIGRFGNVVEGGVVVDGKAAF